MTGQKRILIFVHDGRGLGHLRRLSRLAEKLQERASVLFVTGHREAAYLIPKECEFVHIPSLDSIDRKRSRQWNRSPFLADANLGRKLRGDLLRSCAESFQPHAFISDYLPLGMEQELTPLLRSTPGCKKYFIIRGILGDPRTVPYTVMNPPTLQALREHYNMLLVTCDERIIDVAEEYSLPPDVVEKIVYAGYAAAPFDKAKAAAARLERHLPDGATWVVCSAGGGKDGEDLIQRCWELALSYPEYHFDLIVGPRSRLTLLHEGWYGGSRIRVQQSDTHSLPSKLAAADIVIGRGGYNSLVEAAVGDAHLIVAPIATDYEQVHHARRFSAFRPIHLVDDLADLDRVFESVATLPKPTQQTIGLDMTGLDTASHLILADLAQFSEQHEPFTCQVCLQ